jgi:digeranylgeranylglycerophospholipid reductase
VKAAHYDVVVVGAGPSGSLCARNLARAGYQVLLCEKRPVVGFPVRCGEATGPRKRLSDFMTVNEDYIETTITGAIMHAPGGTSIRYDAGRELGTMLDRTLFDQDVANQAVREGAELQTNARVVEVSGVVDNKRTLTIEQNGQTFDITASMVVGADGAESLIGRKAGFKTRQTPPGSCTAIELRVRVMDPNPHHLTFWSGQDTINNGYVWVFPKVKSGVVNLGCGEQIPKLGAKSMLEIAMEFKERLYPGAEVEAVHGGCVPVSGNLEEYSTDRLLLCGDAAHHTNPLTGGGIMSGIVGGETAAIWIDKGFKAGDLSATFLKQYEAHCWQRFGRNHKREMGLRDAIMGLPARDQEWFYRVFQDMIHSNLSLASKFRTYPQLGVLALKNFGLVKKTLLKR